MNVCTTLSLNNTSQGKTKEKKNNGYYSFIEVFSFYFFIAKLSISFNDSI